MLTVDYSGGTLPVIENMTVIKDLDGHAQIAVDTAVLPVSQLISEIAARVNVKDISIAGDSVDDVVVGLYKEFEI